MVPLDLTPSGEELFQRVLGTRRQVLEDVLEPIATESRSRLEEVLVSLLKHLPGDRDDAWRICRLCEHRVCSGSACPVGHAPEEGPS